MMITPIVTEQIRKGDGKIESRKKKLRTDAGIM